MPLVRDMVHEYFGKESNRTVNPDLAVGLGAAASLIDSGPVGAKHVVTVGHIPEATPEDEIEVEGRTTPASQVQVTGGAEPVTTQADDDGHYCVTVPLSPGINSLKITAITPDNRRATSAPEPVVHDPNAEEREAPAAPPAPRLARGLCISCNLPLGVNRNISHASLILSPQTELPTSFTARHFGTAMDNQQQLLAEIVEGDLPLPELDTRLGEIHLKLPPNVPVGEQVVVHFSVDESYILTAELEVPSVNCRGQVEIDLRTPTTRRHIFDDLEDLLNEIGDHIRPEERAVLQRSRVAIEDLSHQFRELERGSDGEQTWSCYERLQAEVTTLRKKMAETRNQYA